LGRFQIDRDDIEANGCLARERRKSAKVGSSELTEGLLLVMVDGHLSWVGIAGGAGLYFDDAECSAVPSDEVDVAAEFCGSPPSRNDGVAEGAEMEERFALTGGAGLEMLGRAGCAREYGEATENGCLGGEP